MFNQSICEYSYKISDMETTLAIDFGTTNSVAYYCKNGNLTCVDNREVASCYLFPSVVRYTTNGIYVGYAANNYRNSPDSVKISCVKRLIGLTYEEYLQFDAKGKSIFGCDVICGTDGLPRFSINSSGDSVSCIDVAKILFKKIKEAADTGCFGNVESNMFNSAFVTVPANFNDRQCSAIKEAAGLAGLEVVSLIAEPTAAALSYCFCENNSISVGEKILVYDFGGGTFDVSYIRCDSSDHYIVEDVDGNPQLGGNDINAALCDYVCKTYENKSGESYIGTGKRSQRRLIELQDKVEKAKVSLSTEQTTQLELNENTSNDGMTISRAILEFIAEPFVKKTIECINSILSKNRIACGNIKYYILVGGSSKLTAVTNAIKTKLRCSKPIDVDPMACVAKGAAVMMRRYYEKKGGFDEKIVMSYGLGVGKDAVAIILRKGVHIPASKSSIFHTTEDNQTSVNTKIFQYSGSIDTALNSIIKPISQCIFLRELEFSIPSKKPAGKQRLQIELSLAVGGTLKVICTDPDTNEDITYQVFQSVYGGKEIT